jgi:uncharacterized protein (DUF433 family)
MIGEFEVVSIPLETNKQGVIRVKGTRVSLDSILHAYNEGATAEEIVLRYPTCAIEEVYTILSWALNNSDFVTEYLAIQTARRGQLEKVIRQEFPSSGLKERVSEHREEEDSFEPITFTGKPISETIIEERR